MNQKRASKKFELILQRQILVFWEQYLQVSFKPSFNFALILFRGLLSKVQIISRKIISLLREILIYTFKMASPLMNPSSLALPLKHPKYTSSSPFNIKAIFQNKAKWRCLRDSDIIYINKYKPKMVSTVELQSLRYPQINIICNLSRGLTDAKRISSLTTTDSYYFYQDFERLGRLLKTTNHWKNLTFYVRDDETDKENSLNEESLKTVFRFRRCKDLSNLIISFQCHCETKGKILKLLSQQVQSLSKLKTLNLDISPCGSLHRDDETNSSLLTFKYPRSLSSLRLSFQETDSINVQLPPIFASNVQRVVC